MIVYRQTGVLKYKIIISKKSRDGRSHRRSSFLEKSVVSDDSSRTRISLGGNWDEWNTLVDKFRIQRISSSVVYFYLWIQCNCFGKKLTRARKMTIILSSQISLRMTQLSETKSAKLSSASKIMILDTVDTPESERSKIR